MLKAGFNFMKNFIWVIEWQVILMTKQKKIQYFLYKLNVLSKK